MQKIERYILIASGIITKDGQPEKFYHGTRASFDEFRPHFKKNMQLGFGIHFTTDREAALLYTAENYSKGKTPILYTAHLMASKVLDVTKLYNKERNPEIYSLMLELFKGNRRVKPYVSVEGDFVISPDVTSGPRAEKLIKQKGFDAIRYKAKNLTLSGYGSYSKGKEYDSVVVFDPKQIVILNKETVNAKTT